MELLTPNTAKTKQGQNTDGITWNILPENQQQRYIIKTNEGKKDGKEIEEKEVNNSIGKCERRSHAEKNPGDADRLAIENIVFESFGEEVDEKDNKILEEKPFILMEEKQLCEGPLEVTCTVSPETTDDDVDQIAKDMLSFAWQIARGMVSVGQSVLMGGLQ